MDIIDKLKKGKENEPVLDSLAKKREAEKSGRDKAEQQSDIEVRQIGMAEKAPDPADVVDIRKLEKRPVREFRTEGMHEFDMESLGSGSSANIRAEYKVRVGQLIDTNKIEEAISLLQELKEKLSK